MAENSYRERPVKLKVELMKFMVLSFITSILFLSIPFIEKSDVSVHSISAIAMALAGMTTVASLRSYSYVSLLFVLRRIDMLSDSVNTKPTPVFISLFKYLEVFVAGPHLWIVFLGVLAFTTGFYLLRLQHTPLQTEFGQVLILVSGMTSIAVFRALVTPPFKAKARYSRY